MTIWDEIKIQNEELCNLYHLYFVPASNSNKIEIEYFT